MFNLDDEFSKDLTEEIEEVKQQLVKDEDLSYEDIVAIITGVEKVIKKMEHDYELLRLTLKVKKIDLKYSDEYKQYKTINEKEERAELQTAQAKIQVKELEYEIENAKTIRNYYNMLLVKMYESD